MGKDTTAVTLRKNSYYSLVLRRPIVLWTCCTIHSVVNVDFVALEISKLANFFSFFLVIFYCCHKLYPLCNI